ncbi:PREDICTED: uncharacterized protein LOC109212840 [Nicotiana attenuata]|uniref:Uncharacterized protein n=1 Tax=Nicotiana attenuata TaxID=49451 RepID=A0A1J6KFV2_NICAT|nr:PREDICTED: uncharacterized protein LOC109212840 [Nicotiana attenuata]OIT28286.1 hypothetical protein A4A49_21235 [Nicotiana attenuata]
MKDRGKAAAVDNNLLDFNYSISSDMPCTKHPNSSTIGICSYCLKDRLVNLVCTECGEQRLSSCSCSDDISSSYGNSCSVEVGSVGRISFLLENEKNTDQDQPIQQSEQVILLRSSSNCVEIKKSKNGFWKIKRLFKKKREKGKNGVDEKSDICISDAVMGVSRSRSLCSFRGDDFGSEYRFSSAKISDVTGGLLFDSDHEPRKSGFRGFSDAENGNNFKNFNVPNKGINIFPVKESDFSTTMDDSAFIDLKLDLSSEPRSDFCGKRVSNSSDYGYDSAASIGNLRGGSCRINEYDTRMRRGSSSSNGKGKKVWKWIFRKTISDGRKSTSKRDDEINSNLIFKS